MGGPVSETRLRVLEYLVEYMEQSRTAPTRDDIAKALGLGHRASVQYHIETLVEGGYVERATYRHRMLRPTEAGIRAIHKLRELDAADS
jgi:predicted ArsR family transcriptional regulator